MTFYKFVYVVRTKETKKYFITNGLEHADYIDDLQVIMRDHFLQGLDGNAYYSFTPPDVYCANQEYIELKNIPSEIVSVFSLFI